MGAQSPRDLLCVQYLWKLCGFSFKNTGRQNKNPKVKRRERGWEDNPQPEVQRWVEGLGLHGCVAMETTVPFVVMETTARTPIKGASKLFLDPLAIRVAP